MPGVVKGLVLEPGDGGHGAVRIGRPTADPHRPHVIVGSAEADNARIAIRHAAGQLLPAA